MVVIITQLANNELHAQQLAGRRYIDRIFTQYKVDSVFYPAHASLRDSTLPNSSFGSYIDWYNDITIYTYTPLGNTIPRNSTVFLLPGGAFIKLTESDNMDPDASMPAAHSLAKKLVESGYTVRIVKYQLASGRKRTLIDDMVINGLSWPLNPNDPVLFGECKATLEEASYLAFRDFRRILRDSYNNSATLAIDTNRVIITGISAGAVLTYYAGFLETSEIPSSIPYTNFDPNWPLPGYDTVQGTISIPNEVRTEYYPIPKVAGLMPMSGCVLNKSILNNQTPVNSNSFALYMLHGTCDELIHQDTGRIPFKFLTGAYNNRDINAYPFGYGSAAIFNALKGKMRVRIDQVCRGGHGVVTVKGDGPGFFGAWDVYDTVNFRKIDPPNTTDPVFDRIRYFHSGLFPVAGISQPFTAGSPVIGFTPEQTTGACLKDSTIIRPMTSLSVSGAAISGAFVYQDSVKINGGGQRALIYRWKLGNLTKWDTTFTPSLKIPLETLAQLPYTFIAPNTFRYRFSVEVIAFNGCATRSLKNTLTFLAVCSTCRFAEEEMPDSSLIEMNAEAWKENFDVKIFHAANDQKINIISENDFIGELAVYSMDGRIIHSFKKWILSGYNLIDFTEVQLDRSPAGMYLLHLRHNNSIITHKLIKH